MKTLSALHPELMPLTAANAGLSAFRCDTCGNHITKQNESDSPIFHEVPLVECDTCPGEVQQGSITVAPDSVQFLQASAVKDAVWYHATYVDDWFNRVTTGQGMEGEDGDFLYIHVGSEQAARDIARDKYFSAYGGDLDVVLYQVRLKADAVLSPDVVNDDETWRDFSSVTDETAETMGGDAVRYLNRWEAPGSISLLVDARQLEFVSISTLDNPYTQPADMRELVCA